MATNKNFSFTKKSQLILRAKKLQSEHEKAVEELEL